MVQTYELPAEFIVADLEVLKAIAHSTRLDILQSLKRPKTVKNIAKKLKLPATKLYYHVNLMEKHGLIRVVETNIVSGIIEKKYQVTARNYRLQDGLLTEGDAVSEEIGMLLSAIFNTTQSEIKRSIEANKMEPTSKDKRGLLWHSDLRLTQEQFSEFHEQLEEILKKMEKLSGQNEPEDLEIEANLYGMTIAFYPIYRNAEGEGE